MLTRLLEKSIAKAFVWEANLHIRILQKHSLINFAHKDEHKSLKFIVGLTLYVMR